MSFGLEEYVSEVFLKRRKEVTCFRAMMFSR